MYSTNKGNVNISHHKGDLTVQFTNSSSINIGNIRPSCEGHITFGGNKQQEFEFNEKKKEIVWTGPDAEDKWIGGYFC